MKNDRNYLGKKQFHSWHTYLFKNIGDHSDLIQIYNTLKDVGKLGENCIYSLKKLGARSNRFFMFELDFTQSF